MKLDDVVFELQTNYVKEDDIDTIIEMVKANGFDAAKIDQTLETLGYDPIFTEMDDDDFDGGDEKIHHHRRHFDDD